MIKALLYENMRAYITLVFLFPTLILSQIGDQYLVNATSLNVRDGGYAQAKITNKLSQGDLVKVLDYSNTDPKWWYVSYGDITGFVHSDYLIIDPFNGWENIYYSSGVTPECENIKPERDPKYDGELIVEVSDFADVVLKMMKMNDYGEDRCVRVVYVKADRIHTIKEIPEGRYYLKLAYGNQLIKKVEQGNCKIRFRRDAIYKKSSNILDYNRTILPDEIIDGRVMKNYSVPRFKLSLGVTHMDPNSSFDTDKISEADFNK